MPELRINRAHIAMLKSWITANKDSLLVAGVDRIDAHYTDDDLSTGAFDEFHAYRVTNAGSTFTEVPLSISSEFKSLLEALAEGDNFFPGQQGGGGTFRLLVESGVIEHASFEYVTERLEHDVETY